MREAFGHLTAQLGGEAIHRRAQVGMCFIPVDQFRKLLTQEFVVFHEDLAGKKSSLVCDVIRGPADGNFGG
jgi:hypothetical protein